MTLSLDDLGWLKKSFTIFWPDETMEVIRMGTGLRAAICVSPYLFFGLKMPIFLEVTTLSLLAHGG